MDKKFGIKHVVAMGIGTALFVVLTNVQIPVGFIPNTALQTRAAVLAFFSAIFGPVVGGAIGLIGHALGDAVFYGAYGGAGYSRTLYSASSLACLLRSIK